MLNPYTIHLRSWPLKLLVDIHAFCDARCTMCPYPRYSRIQSQGFMDWDLYQGIVEEFGSLGRDHHFMPQMTYCYMGEVFLTRDLPRYVKLALDENIDVYFNTNAYEMTPDKIDALLEIGFKGQFNISFHSQNPDVYQRIMGLDYHRTLSNVLYLLDHYDPGRVLIRGVDDNWPAGEKQRWFDFWKPRGVQLEYLAPVSRCGGVKRLLPSHLKRDKPVRLYGCRNHLPLHEMVILYDGRAVLCCQDMAREVILGHVSTQGLLGVWNSKERIDTVKRLYNGHANSQDFLCSKCEYALGPTEMARSVMQAAWKKVKPRSQMKNPERLVTESIS